MIADKCSYCESTKVVAKEGCLDHAPNRSLCHDHLIASACNGFMPYQNLGPGNSRLRRFYTPEDGIELWKEREAERNGTV